MKRRAAPASATTAKGLAWNGPEAFPRRTDAMRFRARIGLIVVTFVLLTSLVVALAVFNLFEQRQQQEYQTWTRTLSAALAKSVFRDTLEGNRAEVANLLKRVAADNPQIAYILVVDFSGQPFASTFKEGMGVPTEIMAPRQGTDGSNQVLYVNGHEILDISYPIVENLNAHLHVGLDAEIQHKSRLELIRAIARPQSCWWASLRRCFSPAAPRGPSRSWRTRCVPTAKGRRFRCPTCAMPTPRWSNWRRASAT
jgi:hypothetical protein